MSAILCYNKTIYDTKKDLLSTHWIDHFIEINIENIKI